MHALIRWKQFGKVREGLLVKIIKEFPPTEPIVSMIRYQDYVLVATSLHVFKMRSDGTFEPLEFICPESPDDAGC